VRYTGARQMGIKENENGDLVVVLGTEGRILDTFSIPSQNPVEGDSPAPEGESAGETGRRYEAAFDPDDELLRDAILDAARNLNLAEDQIVKAVEKRIGRELSDAEKHRLKLEVDRQRLEDLIQYLHSNLDRKLEKGEQGGRVKIRTPRGYLRRTFAGLDKTQAEKVFNRLKAMGWEDQELTDHVASTLPRRLKRELGYQVGDK
jgi:hypothetical protein